MGNRVNPLFIRKKDLKSISLLLSFVCPFSIAYHQWRTGMPVLQNISSAENGTPGWDGCEKSQNAPCGSTGFFTEGSAIFFMMSRRGVPGGYVPGIGLFKTELMTLRIGALKLL
jgi:hypothetical protein